MNTRNPSQSEGSEHMLYEDKPLRIFPVDRISLDEIRPHEAVNQPDLEAFCRSLREKRYFYKPILIDRESGTILDGTHRWAGLREMDATHAPVIQFNYRNNDEIEVKTWYPFTSEPVKTILDFLGNSGYSYQSRENFDVSEDMDGTIIMAEDGQTFSIDGNPIPLFHDLEQEFNFKYTQNVTQLQSFVEEGHSGFLRKPPSKEDVVDIAREGNAVPPKYTCHIFPFKYPHIMTTIEELVPGE